ncbi:restriction endonuclease subunit S [candidate division KSB1 bacterium]|nr:restriction endonuclease subunit S [candidate division KSB1 bacterium]RQW02955.1 MAG: restriction endonuclease subunit S [candidate division KSB1 bacterium]
MQPQYGYTTKASQEGNLHLLRTTDITSGIINWNNVPFCTENPSDIKKYILSDGDIVISRAGSIGISHLLKNPKRSVFASYLIRFRPLIDKYFFYYFLKSPFYWKQISEKKLGIAVQNINASKLRQIELQLPPLPEQNRIVAKIEELFSELDFAMASLQTAQQQLKVYRQAVLKDAFEGKLTAAWREQQQQQQTSEVSETSEVFDADALLKKIKEERERHYQEQLAEWERACQEAEKVGGKKPVKPKRNREIESLNEEEVSKLPISYSGQIYVKLSEFSEIIGGVTKGRKLENRKVKSFPYLRVANVQDGYLDLKEIKYIDIPVEEFVKYKLEFGDVLYTEGGDKDKLGRGTIWKDEIADCIHQNHIFRARPFENIISSLYLAYYSQTRTAKNYFFEKAKQTVNLASINLTILSNLPVPICSILEQNKIVQEIESRFSVTEKLEETIEQSLLHAEALRQSILKRAFAGKLVPQDPNDEPAEKLLEWIKKGGK